MKPERWKKLDALFHEALALLPEARAAYLAEACNGDEQLREEVERLRSGKAPLISITPHSASPAPMP